MCWSISSAPVAALRRVSQALREGGLVYIAVPNMMAPHWKLDGYWWRAVHTYYFSLPTLRRTALLAGLELVDHGESGAEIWSVFRKSGGELSIEDELAGTAVYHEQLRVIRRTSRFKLLRLGIGKARLVLSQLNALRAARG